MNRQVIVHDLESAPSRAANQITYEIRRRPEVAVPVALLLGFFTGLVIRRTPLARADREPEEREPSWSQILTELKRLLH